MGFKAGRYNKTSNHKNGVFSIFDNKLSLVLDLSVHMMLSVGSIDIRLTHMDKGFQT